MVGIRCLNIISCMAAIASIGSRVVIPIVANGTIIGDSGMRSVQRVIVPVDRESGRFPAGRCGMAHGAIRRKVQRHVVWVASLVEIWGVT